MDAAEYKHVVLGLIFLKYISDSFEKLHQKLSSEKYADPEDPDEYRAENIFWVPKEARWEHFKNNSRQPTIGRLIDDAMLAIEQDNPLLKGVLPKDYSRPALDKQRLGFNPLLIRFIYGEDFYSRPVKISDSGRIRNELQTLCSEALEHLNDGKMRLYFDRISEKIPEVI